MKSKISESIFSTNKIIIPMADVQHIEKHYIGEEHVGYLIISKHTKYNFEHDTWENSIYLPLEEGKKFIKAWTYYRYELDIKPYEEY